MKYPARFFIILFYSGFLIPSDGQEVVKDYDGNVYKTQKIGSRVWMAENLRSTHYRNGEPIPDIKDSKQWDILTSGAFCELNNNQDYTKAFGLLYNWYTIEDVRNVCPGGWHVPSDSEWNTMGSFLTGENEYDEAAVKTSGKVAPYLMKLNESMFKALPEGFRGYDGEFTGIGYGGGGWWTATESTAENALYHGVNYNTAGSQYMEGPKRFGYHIRCIND